MNYLKRLLTVVVTVGLVVYATTDSFGGCSGGSCSNQSQTSISQQNDAVIEQQEQQIRELQIRIDALSATLQRVEQARAIVRSDKVETLNVKADEGIFQIGKQDLSSAPRIQPIQLQLPKSVARPSVSVRAPGTNVQVQNRVNPTPRTSSNGSRWRSR